MACERPAHFSAHCRRRARCQVRADSLEATLAALAAASATARARVRYVGALPRAQLHEAMRLAAMVLNTSESEGQCNSLLEAMLAGTPVVARANPGNTSLLVAPGTVHQRYGLLGTTPDELVSQAQRLLADGARDGALAARLTHAAKAKVGVVNCLLIASSHTPPRPRWVALIAS